LAVDDLDILRVGHVDEDAWSLGLELKPFRVSPQNLYSVGRRLFVTGSITAMAPSPVTHIDLLGGGVVA